MYVTIDGIDTVKFKKTLIWDDEKPFSYRNNYSRVKYCYFNVFLGFTNNKSKNTVHIY